MKIAFVADLHGNLPAVEALDRDIKRRGIETIVFLGDAIGKGPSNAETCDWVRENCSMCVGGNWDWGIAKKMFPRDNYFWEQLGDERMSWLSSLPGQLGMWISGVHFRLLHGRPVTELITGDASSDFLHSVLTDGIEDFSGVICADSHRPFLRVVRGAYVLNTGSVGNSLGVPNVHYLIVDGDIDSHEKSPMDFAFPVVPYDNDAAAQLARHDRALPHQESYIKEVLTGIYSR